MAAVLIVDDTNGCRVPMARLLATRGFEIQCANNGQEALDMLEAGAAPSLVLLDLAMPVMDGLTFLRIIRHDPRWSDLPVIVVSGENLNGPIQSAKVLGADAVFVKGAYEVRDLIASVFRLTTAGAS